MAGLVIDFSGGKMPGMKGKPGLQGDAEQSAVQKFFEAGSDGDWAAATAAFKRAYDICSGGDETDSKDESASEAGGSEE